MSRRLRIARALLATVAALLAGATRGLCSAEDSMERAKRPVVAIESVAVVDVMQGRIVGPRTVLIVDGRIAAIGEPGAVALPPAAVRVDGREHYLMPALVDTQTLVKPDRARGLPFLVAIGRSKRGCAAADRYSRGGNVAHRSRGSMFFMCGLSSSRGRPRTTACEVILLLDWRIAAAVRTVSAKSCRSTHQRTHDLRSRTCCLSTLSAIRSC